MRPRILLRVSPRPDVCPSADGIPGIESSDGRACCLAACGQCGGTGCSTVGAASDCCVTDIVEEGEPCSETGAAPCYIGEGMHTVGFVFFSLYLHRRGLWQRSFTTLFVWSPNGNRLKSANLSTESIAQLSEYLYPLHPPSSCLVAFRQPTLS